VWRDLRISASRWRRRGLSLTELLVVIAIVAILFAILMTTFGAAIRMVRSFR
jgi:prepilin-type N-terminal cleavage/methylation domain-containing protein